MLTIGRSFFKHIIRGGLFGLQQAEAYLRADAATRKKW